LLRAPRVGAPSVGDSYRSSTVKSSWASRSGSARVAKAAIDAGVAEHQVQLAEEQAQQLAKVVTSILTDLGHDPADDEVRKVVRLRLLEGGKAE
jgi:TPP-dependent pyruvate/acetoin dehydrogenase alpha subunit